MDIIQLAICMKDKEYEKALAVAIAARHPNIIVSHLETGEVSCYIETDNSKSILGEAEKNVVDIIKSKDLLIGDDVSKAEEWGSKHVFLDKHVSVGQLCRNIFGKYAELTGKTAYRGEPRDTQIIYIGGCAGGVGVTSIAIGTAVALRRFSNKNVCYLSLEEIANTETFFSEGQNQNNISHLLYKIVAGEHSIPILQDYLIFDRYGTAAVNMPKGINPLHKLSQEDINLFIEFICKKGNFDYILCDGGSSIRLPASALIKSADMAVLVCGEKTSYKHKEFEEVLRSEFCGNENCIINVQNLWDSGFSDPVQGKETIVIEKDDSNLQVDESSAEICIDRGFGAGIKELCKRIEERAGENKYGSDFARVTK